MTETIAPCHTVMGNLTPREAQGVARYHNKLFHGGHPIAHIDADHQAGVHKYYVWCSICPAEPPVSEDQIRAFAQAGFGMREVARRFWEFSRAPDAHSVEVWQTDDGFIFEDQSSSIDTPSSGFRYKLNEMKRYALEDLLPVQAYRLMVVSLDGEPQTGEFVVEASSPGIAIEYHLVTRGCLSYDRIYLEETDQTPDDSIIDVALVFCKPFVVAECERLDAHHTWEPWPVEEGF